MDALNTKLTIDQSYASKLLLTNPSKISSSIDFNILIDNVINEIILVHGDKNKKVLSYQILANYLQYHYYTKIYKLIDRLSALLESAILLNDTERIIMLDILEAILEEPDSTQLFSKIIGKIIPLACRISLKPIVYDYGLNILLILGQSSIRSILVPYTKQVRQMCLTIIQDLSKEYIHNATNDSNIHTLNLNLIATVYSFYVSLESIEAWQHSWGEICTDCNSLLAMIGISNHTVSEINASKTPHTLLLFPQANSVLIPMKGAARAAGIRYYFQALCMILQKMLSLGCSTGLISLDLNILLTIEQILLPCHLEVSVKDPLVFMDGSHGVSSFDISLILPLLKIDILNVILCLLTMNHPCITRVGTELLQPITNLLSKHEIYYSPALMKVVLECITIAMKTSLSGVISNSLHSTDIGNYLLDLLSNEIEDYSNNPLLLSSSSILSQSKVISTSENISLSTHTSNHNSNNNNNHNNKIGNSIGMNEIYNVGKKSKKQLLTPNDSKRSILVQEEWWNVLFNTCESILIKCGITLSLAIRERFRLIIQKGLYCLSQGISPIQYTDRHLPITQVAKLRKIPFAQALFLKLATAEVFIPNHQQEYSNNITLLRKVSEICLYQSTDSNVLSIAKNTMLLISNLLHPVNISFPTIPLLEISSEYLLQTNQYQQQHQCTNEEGNPRNEIPSNYNITTSLMNDNMKDDASKRFIDSIHPISEQEDENNKKSRIDNDPIISNTLDKHVDMYIETSVNNPVMNLHDTTTSTIENTNKILIHHKSLISSTSTAMKKNDNVNNDDEDDMLPDLNIEDEPDSD